MNTKDKKVTNLSLNICKLRDLLEEGDLDKIHSKLPLFLKVKNELVKHVARYIDDPRHELDFNEHDMDELSTDIYNFIRNYQQKFLYSKFFKMAMDNAPIDDKKFHDLSDQIGKEMRIDTDLRECYKTIAYFGLVKYLWSQLDSRKEIGDLLTDTVRSFLGKENIL